MFKPPYIYACENFCIHVTNTIFLSTTHSRGPNDNETDQGRSEKRTNDPNPIPMYVTNRCIMPTI
jgi:hypothetical protein